MDSSAIGSCVFYKRTPPAAAPATCPRWQAASAALNAQDAIWKKMCNVLRWEFIPSAING